MRAKPASSLAFDSVLGDEVLDVGRRHELEGNVDLLVDLFALGEIERCIERALALAGSILEDGDIETACMAASASCVASTPRTTTLLMSLPATFSA